MLLSLATKLSWTRVSRFTVFLNRADLFEMQRLRIGQFGRPLSCIEFF